MNGQSPNNNEIDNQNNNSNVMGGLGMDPTVLGGIQPVERLEPINEIPVTPVQNVINPNMNMVNNTEVVNPNIGIENSNIDIQPQPIPGTVPNMGLPNNGINSNGFVEPNKVENIGTMPPNNNENKKKKSMNKGVFILLILALMLLVAYGVYYLLSLSKSKVDVKLKDNLTVSLGEVLSSDINDYATITGTNSANCTLMTANVDTSKIGDYQYTITCEEDTYTGTISVKDTMAPIVDLNIVYKTVNSAVTVEDFVKDCTDDSKCETELVNASTVNNYLTTVGGPYNIEIKAKDSLDNTTTVHGILYVVPYDIKAFLSCSSAEESMTEFKANKTVIDKLTVGNDGTNISYLGAARREFKYIFTDEAEYKNAIGNKEYNLTFDGQTGLAMFDDENLTLTISTDLDINSLNTDAGGTFPTLYPDILNYYQTTRGYTCQVVTE